MAEHEIDRLFREQLDHREFPYDPTMWDEVADALFAKRRRRLLLWWWLGGLLAGSLCAWLAWSMFRLSANETAEPAVAELPIPKAPAPDTCPEAAGLAAASPVPPTAPPPEVHTTPQRHILRRQASPSPAAFAERQAESETEVTAAPLTSASRRDRLAALPVAGLALTPLPATASAPEASAVVPGPRYRPPQWHFVAEGGLTSHGLRVQAGVERMGRLIGQWHYVAGALLRYEPLYHKPAYRALPAYSFGLSVKEYRLVIKNQLGSMLFAGAGRHWRRHGLYGGLGLLVPLAQQRILSERSWEWAPPNDGWQIAEKGWSRPGLTGTALVQSQYSYTLTPGIQLTLRAQWPIAGNPTWAPRGLWLGARVRLR